MKMKTKTKTNTEAGTAACVDANQRGAKHGTGMAIATNVRAGRKELYPTSGTTDGT